MSWHETQLTWSDFALEHLNARFFFLPSRTDGACAKAFIVASHYILYSYKYSSYIALFAFGLMLNRFISKPVIVRVSYLQLECPPLRSKKKKKHLSAAPYSFLVIRTGLYGHSLWNPTWLLGFWDVSKYRSDARGKHFENLYFSQAENKKSVVLN